VAFPALVYCALSAFWMLRVAMNLTPTR
jgi:hypothetical protein